MIAGLKAFKIWKPMYTHFTDEKYDLFDHHNRIKGVDQEHFEARKDKNVFVKLESKFQDDMQMGYFLLANYVDGQFEPPFQLGPENTQRFDDWKIRRQRVLYTFRQDVDKILSSTKFHPLADDPLDSAAFRLAISGKISPETLAIIDKHSPCLDQWAANCNHKLYSAALLRWRKYRRFVKFDQAKSLPIFNQLDI